MERSRRSRGSAPAGRARRGFAAVVALAAPLLLSAEVPTRLERARLAEGYGQLPLAFEANLGQTDPQVAFLARGAGDALFLTPQEAVLRFRLPSPERGTAEPARPRAGERSSQVILRWKLRGANPSPRVTGLDAQAARSNYFLGNDPSRWRTGVPRFGKVRYESVYPGIDLVYYGRQGRIEFDFVLQPGADPRQIGLDFAGADRIETNVQGDLLVRVRGGTLRQHKPVVYQERDGERQPVAGAWFVEARRRAAFRLGDYDRSRPLVIDPVLVYSTYLGGGHPRLRRRHCRGRLRPGVCHGLHDLARLPHGEPDPRRARRGTERRFRGKAERGRVGPGLRHLPRGER